jgi:phosphate-selective porin OprO and OprP
MNCSKLLLFVLMSFWVLFLQETACPAENNPPLTISAGKGGFFLTSPDGDFVFRLRGYIQADGRFFFDQSSSAVDTFVLRRVRPIFEGTVHKIFDFKIMPDFGGGTTVLQDAYLDAKFNPAFKIRFGKAKTPFGLERLQSATDIIFIERSLATNLVPNRDLGIVVFGDIGGDKFSYAVGVFNGVVDLGSADLDTFGDSKDFAGRVFVKPVPGLGVGIAITAGNQDGVLLSPGLPTYRTQGQLAFFRYRLGTTLDATTLASGTRLRYSPQATFYTGPFGVLAEYVSSSQEVILGTSEVEIENDAWNFTAHFVLTGEPAGYKGVSPKDPFDLEVNKFGAWEVAFRYSQLNIDEDAFPIFADPLTAASQAQNWAVGLNWYLNKNVKFSFSYDNTSFEDANIKTEKVFMIRNQISF